MVRKFFNTFVAFLVVSAINCGTPDPRSDDTVVADTVFVPLDTHKIAIKNATFLGNERRCFYGNDAPDSLRLIWKYYLGKGKTRISSKHPPIEWAGAGWTGQPLVVEQDTQLFLLQGAYDHRLKKINAKTGRLVWEYAFDDAVKGTGTIWYNKDAADKNNMYVILQGSRYGMNHTFTDDIIPSYRAVSFFSGKELWRLNSKRTLSYSRDVDASALMCGDTAYIGLENGLFTAFSPDVTHADSLDGIFQPEVYSQDTMYTTDDYRAHNGNLVAEASPCKLGNRIFVASGSGHVYGYNLKTRKIDWDFYIGSDMDGSPVVTNDGCLLVAVERQYIPGKGGVFKLDPSRPAEEAVVWYFPTNDAEFAGWEGGVIGSVGINDYYEDVAAQNIAVFLPIDGALYMVQHNVIDAGKMVEGPQMQQMYPTPKLLHKLDNVGPSISTPLVFHDKIVAATYNGISLYGYDHNFDMKLLAHNDIGEVESTPFVHNRRVYIASRSGYLYCFGD